VTARRSMITSVDRVLNTFIRQASVRPPSWPHAFKGRTETVNGGLPGSYSALESFSEVLVSGDTAGEDDAHDG
jgi:hypothetical protein